MCVDMYVYVWWMYTYVHMYTEANLWCQSLVLSLWAMLKLWTGAHSLLIWLAREPQGSMHLCLAGIGIVITCDCTQHMYISGDQTRVLMPAKARWCPHFLFHCLVKRIATYFIKKMIDSLHFSITLICTFIYSMHMSFVNSRDEALLLGQSI